MTKKARPCGNTQTGGSIVQSLIFPKHTHKRWTAKKAQDWAKNHGYVHSHVDDKPNTFRIRQFDPASCEYRTIPFGKTGIQGVVEFPPHDAPAHVLQELEAELGRRAAGR